jgi:hypothetical protein
MIRKLCSSEASPTALRVGSRGGLLSQPVAAPITPLLRGADAPHPRNPRRITLAHHGDAVGLVAQRAETGDVVGMQVGVHRLDELELELAYELSRASDWRPCSQRILAGGLGVPGDAQRAYR